MTNIITANCGYDTVYAAIVGERVESTTDHAHVVEVLVQRCDNGQVVTARREAANLGYCGAGEFSGWSVPDQYGEHHLLW